MSATERLLPLFPLERAVLFPGMPLPLHVFEERYRLMIATCEVTDRTFGVLLITAGREVGEPPTTVKFGCTARIETLDRLPDGRLFLVAVGAQRFRLLEEPGLSTDGYLVARVEVRDESEEEAPPAALVERIRASLGRFLTRLQALSSDPATQDIPELPTDPQALAFRACTVLPIRPRERQMLLEAGSTRERLVLVGKLLHREHLTLEVNARAPRSRDREQTPFSLN